MVKIYINILFSFYFATRWPCSCLQPFTIEYMDRLSNIALQWSHYERDGVWNHRRLDLLLYHLFRRRSKKTSKLRVTGLCEGNSPVTGELPAQRTSNAENVSIWWHHHDQYNGCQWLGDERMHVINSRSCFENPIMHFTNFPQRTIL